MAEITATLDKKMREMSGEGMMDCKKSLVENCGDLDEARDWLRTKGLAAAAKKAGRVAAEGLVGIATDGPRGALVEVNAETDFVARNDGFQAFVREVAGLALTAGGDLDTLKQATYPGTGRSVSEELTQLIATVGENMTLRRAAVLWVDEGVIASYMHNQVAPGLGKIGVLVGLHSTGEAQGLAALGKDLAMHVAATAPQAVDRDGVDSTLLDRERAILTEQARATGKPEAIIEKMVEGRLRKYYEEVCLLEQAYVKDSERKVSAVLQQAVEDLGSSIKVTGFHRYQLGEGI